MDTPQLYTEKLQLLQTLQATLATFRTQFAALEKNEARFVSSCPEDLAGIAALLETLENEVDALTEAVAPLAWFES